MAKTQSGFTPEQSKYLVLGSVLFNMSNLYFQQAHDGVNDWLDLAIGNYLDGLHYLALTAANIGLTYEDSAAMAFQAAAYDLQQHRLYD